MRSLLVLVCVLLAVALAVVVMPIRKPKSHRPQATASLRDQRTLHHARRGGARSRSSRRPDVVTQPFLNYFDSYYVANFSLGTPGQQLSLGLDTGTSDFWVISNTCNAPQCAGFPESEHTKTLFDKNASSSWTTDGSGINDMFGDYRCTSGAVGNDTISFAGFTVQRQEVAVCNYIYDVVGFEPVDGFVGLAFSSLAEFEAQPFVENIVSLLDAPLFTLWLEHKPATADSGAGGQITWGGIDTTNCDSNINYIPLTTETYWQFSLTKFSVGTYSVAQRQDVMVDSGLSNIGVPYDVAESVYRTLKSNYDINTGYQAVNCKAPLPDLVFTFGGRDYSISQSEYLVDVGLGGGKCAIFVDYFEGFGFAPSYSLGDPFLRRFCTVHDLGNARIGLATAIQN